MNIALFDFDGTITHADMYTKFLHFSATKRRSLIAKIVLSPFFILYKVGVLRAANMRRIASFVAFSGRKVDEVVAVGQGYAENIVPQFLREEALTQLSLHTQNGDQIVIVSASLDVYLKHWCAQNGFALICSELEVKRGKFSGGYVNGDCSGVNKSKWICAKFDLGLYDRVYAYGDTQEDLAMLSLADEAYLNWARYCVDAAR
ncbi:HAD-IB family hydrolase [Echinimonas agarilytica]|uniref:Haloacid dehalogenase-like hydrolase n=1 Tax=Echinimonas agarilytica TaxID=1215918 RepID=A0AA41W7Z4_9GAMM|nr:HAD-IB family hydrolase [Echinimonas agarilytica]MCM2680323.1 haloacid dehalogenase-like hydrolase [Echinimonas agarilytica]